MLCPRCQRRLDSTEFSVSSRRSTGRQLWCRTCKSKYDAELYRSNSSRRNSIKTRNRLRAVENAKRTFLYLLAHPCVECGEDDPVVLEFDHVRGRKTSSVANMVRGGAYRWETVAAEMAKCMVRCANCHRRRTALQREYHRSIEVQLKLAVGIEPTTPALRVRCSTAELRQRTPVEALRTHFGMESDGTCTDQTAINEFLDLGPIL